MPQCQFPVFYYFIFQKSCTGNIFGWTKQKPKGGSRAATPVLGVAWPWPTPKGGVGPLASTNIAAPPI
jgi:hypothetical protein